MYEKELKIAIRAAKKAGAIAHANFRKKHTLTDKGVDGFATEADVLCEKAIISILQKHFPEYGILAEESGEQKTGSEYCWAIDPIDGTHNYMHGIPLYGVMIALLKNFKPVVGVIYLPEQNEFYWAVKGNGSFCSIRRRTSPIHVSSSTQPSIISFSSHFTRNVDLKKALFPKIISISPEIRALASIAVAGCYLASGKIDGSVVPGTSPWDSGTPALIVEEAGGTVTDFIGRPYNLKTKPLLLIMSNGKIHKQLLDVVKGI